MGVDVPSSAQTDVNSSSVEGLPNSLANSVVVPRKVHIVGGLLVFASFLAFSVVRSPIPGVNEPHFLSKAKHYWDPAWCAGDFFLDSSNPHLVFYQTVGFLTQWCTLEQTAWIGRIGGLLLLTIGWTQLVRQLVQNRWSTVWAAWTLLAIAAAGNLSGEWIVGGIEAKVVCYALLFWAMAFVCRRCWHRAAICAGLAVSFHPVIGVWSLTCGVFAGLVWLVKNRLDGQQSRASLPPAASMAVSLSLLVVTMLPGLIPALGIDGQGSSNLVFRADYIQLFYRLAHHLNPTRFSMAAYGGYALLIAFAAFALRGNWWDRRQNWFAWFVLGSILIAVFGLIAGWSADPPRRLPTTIFSFDAIRMKLLKFYPFRLADVMVPVAAAVATAVLAAGWIRREVGWIRREDGWIRREDASRAGESRPTREGKCWLLFSGLIVFALLQPAVDRNPSKLPPDRLADWIAACQWIAGNTPTDAHVITPMTESWAFKWYADRAEWVVPKDCPQDAAGILEWNRRLRMLRRWRVQADKSDVISEELLQRLRSETAASHIMATGEKTFAIEPIHRNDSYAVYRLADVEPADGEHSDSE